MKDWNKTNENKKEAKRRKVKKKRKKIKEDIITTKEWKKPRQRRKGIREIITERCVENESQSKWKTKEWN